VSEGKVREGRWRLLITGVTWGGKSSKKREEIQKSRYLKKKDGETRITYAKQSTNEGKKARKTRKKVDAGELGQKKNKGRGVQKVKQLTQSPFSQAT